MNKYSNDLVWPDARLQRIITVSPDRVPTYNSLEMVFGTHGVIFGFLFCLIFPILSWSYWSDNQIKCIFAQILEYSFRVNFDLHSCISRSSHMIGVTWFIFIISSLSSRPIYFLLGSGWIIKTILEHVRIWNMTFCWLFCIHDIITSRNLIFGPISGMVK